MSLFDYKNYTLSTLNPNVDLDDGEKKYFENNCQDGRYFNQWGITPNPKLTDVVKWQTSRNTFSSQKKQKPLLPSAPYPVGGFKGLTAGTRVMWLGHATFFIEMDGLHIITDPVFGTVAKVNKRHVALPVSVEDIPKLDVVLLSHGHFDHTDTDSLKGLAKRFGDKLLFVVPNNFRRLLPDECENVVEMNWWRTLKMDEVKLTFVPAQHWHLRSATDLNQSLWGGWVVEGQRRVYFCGDSGYFPGFSLLGKLFGGFDLAILPLGCFEPRWMMSPQHMSPEQSLDAFVELNAKHFLGMHWGTYDLADEPLDHGPRVLADLIKERDLDPLNFHILAHGGSIGFDGNNVKEAYNYDETMASSLKIPGTIFDGASDEDIKAVNSLSRALTADAGEMILVQDAPGDQLLYILTGEVEIVRDDTVFAKCTKNQIIGEMALYMEGNRTVSVRAVSESHFLLLSAEDLKTLKDAKNSVAWNLERIIIGNLSQRMRETISQTQKETALPQNSFSIIGGIKTLLTSSPKREYEKISSARNALRHSGLFDDETDEVVEELATILRPEKYEANYFLCKQGDKADEMYFVTSGSVDVKKNEGKNKMLTVGSLKLGAVIGLLAMVDRKGRSVNCVTSEPTTALVLDYPTWTKLFNQNDEIGSAMRVAIIKSFCRQLAEVNTKISKEETPLNTLEDSREGTET